MDCLKITTVESKPIKVVCNKKNKQALAELNQAGAINPTSYWAGNCRNPFLNHNTPFSNNAKVGVDMKMT